MLTGSTHEKLTNTVCATFYSRLAIYSHWQEVIHSLKGNK